MPAGRKEYEASLIGWLCQLDHQSPTFQDNQLIWLATTATAVVVVAEYFVLILTHYDFPSNTKLSISFVRPRALPNHWLAPMEAVKFGRRRISNLDCDGYRPMKRRVSPLLNLWSIYVVCTLFYLIGYNPKLSAFCLGEWELIITVLTCSLVCISVWWDSYSWFFPVPLIVNDLRSNVSNYSAVPNFNLSFHPLELVKRLWINLIIMILIILYLVKFSGSCPCHFFFLCLSKSLFIWNSRLIFHSLFSFLSLCNTGYHLIVNFVDIWSEVTNVT